MGTLRDNQIIRSAFERQERQHLPALERIHELGLTWDEVELAAAAICSYAVTRGWIKRGEVLEDPVSVAIEAMLTGIEFQRDRLRTEGES